MTVAAVEMQTAPEGAAADVLPSTPRHDDGRSLANRTGYQADTAHGRDSRQSALGDTTVRGDGRSLPRPGNFGCVVRANAALGREDIVPVTARRGNQTPGARCFRQVGCTPTAVPKHREWIEQTREARGGR